MFGRLVIKNYRCFSDSEPLRLELSPGMTAIVGPNNSGKSTILRAFFELRWVFRVAHQQVHQILQAANFGTAIPGFQLEDLGHDGNNRPIVVELHDAHAPEIVQDMPAITGLVAEIPRTEGVISFRYLEGKKRLEPDRHTGFHGEAISHQGKSYLFTPLRTICEMLSNTMYVGAFRNAVNFTPNEAYFDISTGSQVFAEWRSAKTGEHKGKNQLAYKLQEQLRDIFGYKSLDINASEDGKSLKVLVDGRPYRLSEMGAGLSQFIVVLLNAIKATPSFILIDEPECGLHPSLQLSFLTTIASYASRGLMYSTHSVGLAKLADRALLPRSVNR